MCVVDQAEEWDMGYEMILGVATRDGVEIGPVIVYLYTFCKWM